MKVRTTSAATLLVAATVLSSGPAAAQKAGGTLRLFVSTNPPSASIHEELTVATVVPFMAVFNNLVLFQQNTPRPSIDTIVPDLAESWAWDASRTKLTFKLRQGVKWHDGKPFTAADVQCTWHRLLEKEEYFRRNPRRLWYANLKEVTVNGEHEATFHLSKPQPALTALLASGMGPVYPCHKEAKDMRTNPIGTGPFKLAEFKHHDSIKFVRNPDYWKPGRPYLDAIEWRIVTSQATRTLAFVAGEVDRTFIGDATIPVAKQIALQAPKAICKFATGNATSNLLINRDVAPFSNPELRRAMVLAIDRQAFNDIINEGKGLISGAMLPPPYGNWGMPPEVLKTLPSYAGDQATREAEGRKIMESLGYRPSNRLKVRVSTRDWQIYRDRAVILVDQLKKIHFDAELEVIESSVWFGRMVNKNYVVALNLTGAAVDDPDSMLKENYACGSENNFAKYCDAQVEELLDRQSHEADAGKRKALVWEIERRLAEDAANPIIHHNVGYGCWHPHLKGYVQRENDIYSNWRSEDVWLDK
jgi:peptide/nickel transport system substrate-binding protein